MSAPLTEFLALCHWDERLVRAFRRACREYIAAGSPGVPFTATDYRKQFAPDAEQREVTATDGEVGPGIISNSTVIGGDT